METIHTLLTVRTSFTFAFAASTLLACTSIPFVDEISENQSGRVDYLILHYTSEDFAESLRLLTKRTERPVSSHYLIPERGDLSYPHRNLKVYRLVQEDQRAWHAGRSYWRGNTNLNNRSIGIEIVNRAKCEADEPALIMENPESFCVFSQFDAEQIALVVDLVLDILRRHPNIDPDDILAHSDIAPDRKLDPGPTFPWHTLYQNGIGAWYDDDTVQRYLKFFGTQTLDLHLLQKALLAYGYDVAETGELDTRTRYAIRAFQMHFRPSNWSGQPDAETAAILFALLEKYSPSSLEALAMPSFIGSRTGQAPLFHNLKYGS